MSRLQKTLDPQARSSPISASSTSSEMKSVQQCVSTLQMQVTCSWQFLRQVPGGAVTFFSQALERSQPVLPCRISSRPLSSHELNSSLARALANYHPEEIKVVAFTLFSSLVDLVREHWGDDEAELLLRILSPTSSSEAMRRTWIA